MVAGDPQWKLAEKRLRDGIPVGAGLMAQVRQIAQAARRLGCSTEEPSRSSVTLNRASACPSRLCYPHAALLKRPARRGRPYQ